MTEIPRPRRADAIAQPTLSVVVPVYDEGGNIARLHAELVTTLRDLGMAWELIFVDDGSSDTTWSEIERLHETDPRVRGIRFSRNFGHQYALFAGLTNASGDAVVSMDGDLQHPPSLIPVLVDKWREGYEVVHTQRIDSGREPLFKRLATGLFYRVFAFLSGAELRGMADFRLLDKKVVDKLCGLREEGLFLRGLVQWVGFQSTKVEFVCEDRHSGTTKYSLRKMIKLAWNGTTSFSLVPLRVGVVIGIVTSALSFGYLAFAIAAKLLGGWAKKDPERRNKLPAAIGIDASLRDAYSCLPKP